VSADDLSKLRIDRSLAPVQTRRRKKWWWLAALTVLGAAGAAWFAFSPRATAVQTTPIVTTFPSQQFVVLNSSGYVVAQLRKQRASEGLGPARMARGRWKDRASRRATSLRDSMPATSRRNSKVRTPASRWRARPSSRPKRKVATLHRH
jgi:hypothetical protein